MNPGMPILPLAAVPAGSARRFGPTLKVVAVLTSRAAERRRRAGSAFFQVPGARRAWGSAAALLPRGIAGTGRRSRPHGRLSLRPPRLTVLWNRPKFVEFLRSPRH